MPKVPKVDLDDRFIAVAQLTLSGDGANVLPSIIYTHVLVQLSPLLVGRRFLPLEATFVSFRSMNVLRRGLCLLVLLVGFGIARRPKRFTIDLDAPPDQRWNEVVEQHRDVIPGFMKVAE